MFLMRYHAMTSENFAKKRMRSLRSFLLKRGIVLVIL